MRATIGNNGLTPWRRHSVLSPFFGQEFDRLFDVPTRPKQPAVDIRETDDSLILSADLPGMKKEELDVEVHDGVLTLSGERKLAENPEGETKLRVERDYGKFTRSFKLPDTVDTERVDATYADGVLEIRLSKIEAPKPKTIDIK